MKRINKAKIPVGKIIKNVVLLNNKKYPYTIFRINKLWTHVECKAAGISQHFLTGDIGNLILDLPNLIIAEKEYLEKQNEVIRFRVSVQERRRIEQKSAKEGFSTLSAFLRHLALGN